MIEEIDLVFDRVLELGLCYFLEILSGVKSDSSLVAVQFHIGYRVECSLAMMLTFFRYKIPDTRCDNPI